VERITREEIKDLLMKYHKDTSVSMSKYSMEADIDSVADYIEHLENKELTYCEHENAKLREQLGKYSDLKFEDMPNSTELIEHCDQRFEIESSKRKTYELHKQSFMSGYMNGFMASPSKGEVSLQLFKDKFFSVMYGNDMDAMGKVKYQLHRKIIEWEHEALERLYSSVTVTKVKKD